MRERLQNLMAQVDPQKDCAFLRSDLCERVERTANWLLLNIRKQKKIWSEATFKSGLAEIAAEWDATVVDAALNEAGDFAIRAEVASATIDRRH